MNAADKHLAVKALIYGLTELAKDTEADVRTVRDLTGAKSFDRSLGAITVAKGEPKITFQLTDPAVVAFARAEYPHEVVEEHQVTVPAAVRSTLLKTLADRFKITRKGEVLDTATGELITWASVQQPGKESIRATLTDDTKAEVAEVIAERFDQLVLSLGEAMPDVELEA